MRPGSQSGKAVWVPSWAFRLSGPGDRGPTPGFRASGLSGEQAADGYQAGQLGSTADSRSVSFKSSQREPQAPEWFRVRLRMSPRAEPVLSNVRAPLGLSAEPRSEGERQGTVRLVSLRR